MGYEYDKKKIKFRYGDHMLLFLKHEKARQEDCKLKDILGYTVSSRAASAIY